jgi:hypothetical protein
VCPVQMQPPRLASSLHNPFLTALYRACEQEVKKDCLMPGIKKNGLGDLRSVKRGERPVGVPAARGHGVMEVQTFESLRGSRTRSDSACGNCAGR